MSKKKARLRPKLNKLQQVSAPKRKTRSKRKSIAVIALILCLGLTSLVLAQWRTLRSSFSPLMPVPTPTPTPQLSKEYIYAGGKLVATEEPNATPTPTPNVTAPSNLVATAQFSNQILTGVELHWSSPSGTVDHFRIERTQDKNTPFAPLPSTPGSNDTTFTDTTASSNTAYLYRICAVDGQGNLSTYSNVDLSTTVYFVDEPLVAYSQDHANATIIKAAHFTQLRNAINAVRHLVDPQAADFQWTTTNNTPAPQVGGGIYASHLMDLRSNLAAALSALNLPAVNYEHQTITQRESLVYKIDIQELRDAVK